jgi:O-antigen/teichoic acid export membrane protein
MRRNFIWAFTGNIVSGFLQWAVLSVIAKLGTSQMLGEYAYALAMMLPVTMFSHMNLRSVLATDMERRHTFGDYMAARLWTSAGTMLVVVAIAFVFGRGTTGVPVMVLVGLMLTVDIVSGVHHGALQRDERLAEISISLIARTALALAAFAVTLFSTRSLVPSVAMLVAARVATLLAYDQPVGGHGQCLKRSEPGAAWEIFKTALPLGVVQMLVSYTGNIPRYAVEHFQGSSGLGVFAALAAFLTAGCTVTNALGQSMTPRLARFFSRGQEREFRHLTLRFIGLSIALGAASVLGAAVLGGLLLRVLYRAEYGAYSGLLVELMMAATLVYAASALGYVITSARSFLAQMPLLGVVVVTSAASSWLLVPAMGLRGAALAVACGAAVQIAGEWWIMSHALRRMRPMP